MEIKALPDYTAASEWMIILILGMLFIVSYVRWVYPRRFLRLWRAMINQNSLYQIMREELVFSHRGSLLLMLVFLLAGGLFWTLTLQLNPDLIAMDSQKSLVVFGAFSSLILLIYFIKWVANALILNLFEPSHLFRTYMFLVISFNKMIGLLLLPMVVLMAYLPQHLARIIGLVGLGIWSSILLLRLIKAVSISHSNKIKWYYIILYLCALEISPVLVGIKWVEILNQ